MVSFSDDATYGPRSSFNPCMIVVQARLGSTRLPGKIFKTVNGKPLLSYLVERLRRVQNVDGICIATTTNPLDAPIREFCDHESLHCISASEEDVLSRYVEAADLFGLDAVVRISSDCPLLDPEILDKALLAFWNNYERLDYLSNCLERSYPRGMDFEIVRKDALKKAYFATNDPMDREHVTRYIINHPEHYRLANFSQKSDESAYRLTVDTQEDFQLIEHIIQELYPKNPLFCLNDIVTLLKKHPDWVKLNEHIKQKST